jgi:hypothetical protein
MLVESEPLPEAVIGKGQGYAASARFQSDHPGKRVGQTERHAFTCGSAYEPGLMSHLPGTGRHAVGLKTGNDVGFLYKPLGSEPYFSESLPI